ncbi:MAG: hypothetical protein RSB78_01595 [Oscillospiraceae bacterium]
MEILKLIGVVIVIVGFALKFDTLITRGLEAAIAAIEEHKDDILTSEGRES